MEIISLHKRCDKKTRKVSQPKKASSKSDEPKKVSGLIDDPSEEGQKPKRASRSSDGKKTLQRQEKKLKRARSLKKHQSQSHLNLLPQARKEKKMGCPRTIKGKKYLLYWMVKEENKSFFDPQKDSKNLTIEKKVEKVVFMAGPYEGYELSYVALCDTKYLKRVLKMSGLEKKTKDLIKQALRKT